MEAAVAEAEHSLHHAANHHFRPSPSRYTSLDSDLVAAGRAQATLVKC